MLLIEPLGTKSSEIWIRMYIFKQKKSFDKAVCKISAIIVRFQCVDAFENVKFKFTPFKPRYNCRHFADGTLKCIFMNEAFGYFVKKKSLKFVSRGPINNIPALVQIMTWRRSGDKPLSEPTMVRLLTRICVTRPQLVNCVICISLDFTT